MELRLTDFKDVFNKAYILQIQKDYTQENLDIYGLEKQYMELLYENKSHYVVKYDSPMEIETINVIDKIKFVMVSTDISG